MKPDWKDAPEWANWLAMDDDGAWYWHKEKPEVDPHGAWFVRSSKLAFAGRGGVDNEFWEETLEARP